MKRIFMVAGAMLIANVVFAQYAPLQIRHHAILNGLLQHSRDNGPAMKTTSVAAQRVIAQSTRDNTANALNDSVWLGYGGSNYRFSAYDYNTMLYAYNYPYSTSPMFNNAAGIFARPQVLFDTFMHWSLDPHTASYGYYETAYAGYDANNSMTSYKDLFADSSVNPNMVYTNKFNAAKNIDTAYRSIWQAGSADSAFKQSFSYNTSHQIIKDSTYELHLGVWRIAGWSTYTYNGSNDLIQIDNYANTADTSFLLPLVEQAKYVNTYDGSHRLLSVFSSFFDGSALSPYIKDTFAYSGAYTYHNAWREYQYDPINAYWAPMFNMTKTINTLGLPDTIKIQGFDSLLNAWVPQSLYVPHYNSFKNPDTLRDYEYNFTAFPATPDFTTIYYYQTFINKTEVKELPANVAGVMIFPNPATDQFTISRLNVVTGSKIIVSLLNVNGQLVSRQMMPWQGQAQISVSNLMPGTYWVMIQDGNGGIIHRQAITRN